LPKAVTLSQNYPNPFNPSTTIEFDLPSRASIRLEIVNILGQRVVTLVDEELAVGHHQYMWNGRLPSGTPAPSGVYLYRLWCGDQVISKKMLLVK
jgi:flagellar hook assembly protein FlgD